MGVSGEVFARYISIKVREIYVQSEEKLLYW